MNNQLRARDFQKDLIAKKHEEKEKLRQDSLKSKVKRNAYQQKKLDEQLSQIDYRYSQIKNPYMEEAQKSLVLSTHNFSVNDLARAEAIL